MLISLLTLLISNALTLRKDKSILFSRIVMVSLTLKSYLAFNNLFFLSLDENYGILAHLFHVNVSTEIYTGFIVLIAILSVTSAVYYFNIIKNMFYYDSQYVINPSLEKLNLIGNIQDSEKKI